MKELRVSAHTAAWFSLVPGTLIDACDASGRRWSGTVELTHHELGLVWIHDQLASGRFSTSTCIESYGLCRGRSPDRRFSIFETFTAIGNRAELVRPVGLLASSACSYAPAFHNSTSANHGDFVYEAHCQTDVVRPPTCGVPQYGHDGVPGHTTVACCSDNAVIRASGWSTRWHRRMCPSSSDGSAAAMSTVPRSHPGGLLAHHGPAAERNDSRVALPRPGRAHRAARPRRPAPELAPGNGWIRPPHDGGAGHSVRLR